jgi:hypothetical protein
MALMGPLRTRRTKGEERERREREDFRREKDILSSGIGRLQFSRNTWKR